MRVFATSRNDFHELNRRFDFSNPDVPWEPVSHWKSSFSRLRRSLLFPFLIYLVATQVLRDEYPVSHYPMYSNPTPRPLRFQYLADAEGTPLAVLPATGITPSHLGKKFGLHKKQMIEADLRQARKEGRPAMNEETFKEPAGMEVLAYVREQNLKRGRDRRLPPVIQLMEITLEFAGDTFQETHRAVAADSISP